MTRNNSFVYWHVVRDIAIVILSVFVAALLMRSGIIHNLVFASLRLKLFGSFVAGLFFTTVFTTPLSVAAFTEIAQTNSVLWVAILGAAGAMIGDLIMFRFIREGIVDDIRLLARLNTHRERWTHIFHKKIFRYLTPFIGALIIASPLPDEIGIAMLGLSGMRTSWFAPTSFIFYFIGILLIGIVGKSMS